MRKIGIDFGTGNTVIAIWSETLQTAETLVIPGISTSLRYRLRPGVPEQTVSVIPSLIHYSETEVLIGDQVLSRGLAEHPDTIRWMKRSIGAGNTKRKNTAQGFKSNAEAAQEFLILVLRYAADRVDVAHDEFTFTAPCESFENYQDWLHRVADALELKRIRFLDEPTACVTGYRGSVRSAEVFAVFDFGCGTLDVSVVRIDVAAAGDVKAIQLGQAGDDLGGMDLDKWLTDDFFSHHRITDAAAQRDLGALVLRRAEEAKITLSDPAVQEAEMLVLDDRGSVPRSLRREYRRTCPACELRSAAHRREPDEGCMGCLLAANDFLRRTEAVLDRALENASIKAAIRRSDIAKVLVTGGTSLVPSVRALLDARFPGRVEYANPFDAVARGACQGLVTPILAHDYAIASYNEKSGQTEFVTLFKTGTEFPTDYEVRLWATIAFDGQTRLAPLIYEVSQLKRRLQDGILYDEKGNPLPQLALKIATEFIHQCLNDANRVYIIPKPPVVKARDQKRFRCRFRIDEKRRLLLTVEDHHPEVGREILTDQVVVRL